jgi:hypothetical protein
MAAPRSTVRLKARGLAVCDTVDDRANDTLMEKSGNLTKAEREMIVVATSNSNRCQYCFIAHGSIL